MMDDNSNMDLQNPERTNEDSIHDKIAVKPEFGERNSETPKIETITNLEPANEPKKESGMILQKLKFLKSGSIANIGTGILNDTQSIWHNKKVVIKRTIPEKFNEENYRELFLKEYLLLSDINHENIVKVIRQGEVKSGLFYIIEYIDGGTLSELIEPTEGIKKNTGLPLNKILIEILEGLKTIHEAGIIHRDISPGNIMIENSTNTVKIISFNHAKSAIVKDNLLYARISPYSAPEQQLNALSVDNRADIYAFGIVLLELITGSTDKMKYSDLTENFPKLAEIILKCTEEQPEKRYNDVSSILNVLSGSDDLKELITINPESNIKSSTDNSTIKDEKNTKLEKGKKDIEPLKDEKKPKYKKKLIKTIVPIAVGVILIIVLIAILMFSRGNNKSLSVEFTSAAGEIKAINLDYSGKWEKQMSIDWVEVNEVEGNQGKIIIKTLTENKSIDERSGTITILDEKGKLIKAAQIRQSGSAPFLMVSNDKITLPTINPQPFKLNIKSNLGWIAKSAVDWIKITPMKGNNDGDVVISVSSSDHLVDSREGEINITSDNDKFAFTILVAQSGRMRLEFDKSEIILGNNNERSVKIKVNANIDWKFADIPLWLNVEPSAGKSGETDVTFSVVSEINETNKIVVNAISLSTNTILNSLTIDFKSKPPIPTATGKWSYSDLSSYLRSISNSSTPINFSEIYTKINKKCKVYYFVNGKKMTSTEEIDIFINKVKLTGQGKVVEGSIIYGNDGKIIEFCQE